MSRTFVLDIFRGTLFIYSTASNSCIFLGNQCDSTVRSFYCCTVHFDNTKIPFTNECALYQTYKMLTFAIKTSMHSLLHVSVHLDHPQGAYADPF
jgi:hypothetical protein